MRNRDEAVFSREEWGRGPMNEEGRVSHGESSRNPARQTLRATSAGGVVFRQIDRPNIVTEVVLVGQSRTKRWGLPKGAPTEGETLEAAALREVKEETGIVADIVVPLGHIEYWFAGRGARFHKTAHFYLMRATGGDVSLHDFEHDVVNWFPLEEAARIMSYTNEKEILRRASTMLGASKKEAS